MSTAEWLRAIDRFDLPDGWRLASVGSRYDIQLGKMLNADRAAEPHSSGAAPYLRNVNVQWGLIETDDLKWMRFSADDRAKYALGRGDLLVCEGGEIGRCAIWDSDREGCFFQKALMRVRPRGPDSLDWLARCIRALADGGALSAGAEKSTIDHLPAEKLRALRIPLPEPEEQREIVGAPDAETTRIDALFSNAGRMKLLIAERLDREVSRIAGYQSVASQRLCHAVDGIEVGVVVQPAALYAPSGIPFLRGVNVRAGELVLDDLKYLDPAKESAAAKSRLRTGDIVLVRTGQAGAAVLIPPELDGANCVDLLIVRPGPRVVSEYLELLLNSEFVRSQVAALTVGSIQSHFNVGALRETLIPLPGVADQRKVVARANEVIGRHQRLLAAIDRQIALLRERRQALITAAVTGKLQVTTTTRANAAA